MYSNQLKYISAAQIHEAKGTKYTLIELTKIEELKNKFLLISLLNLTVSFQHILLEILEWSIACQ